MRELVNGSIDWDDRLWRYISVARFLDMLNQRTLHFASANQFEDQFEGAVFVEPVDEGDLSPMGFVDHAFFELKRLTKISCWHRRDYESDAMWRLYGAENKGVAICSTPERMRAALKPFRLAPEFGIEDLWAGPVEYVDLTRQPLTDPGMLERFFKKHRAFEWEQEFRLAISLRMAEEFGVRVPVCGISVDVDLDVLVDRVVLGPSVSGAQYLELHEPLQRAGLSKRLQRSTLFGRPRYVTVPAAGSSGPPTSKT
ncbi:MAG: DUF2971 domain-containing protein [Gammaproteobacteria bacterium]|nr:DUF2971 domain-containing protein [Gammaproteobacteria bacterium]